MRTLRDLPIKQKLLVIIIVSTTAALLFSGIAIVAADSFLYHVRLRHDLSSLARLVGDNSTAALEFNDSRVGLENLNALRTRSHLLAACLYQQDGTLLARYLRPGANTQCPAPAAREELRSGSKGIFVSHPVLLNGRRAGTLVLLYDLGELIDRIQVYGGIVLIVLLGSSLVAIATSSRMRDTIAIPLTRLAGAATSISETGDYGIRVEKDSRDELGVLVDSFNEMVRRIQSRDTEIQNARNSLQTTLASIGDAVVSTDAQGRIVFVNAVACSLLGWKEAEIAGRPLDEVFQIVNEFSRTTVESPVERVLRDGKVSGLANHTILVRRDGTEIPIDDSAAPIRQGGRTIGVVLVFRDMSERRRAQEDAAYLASIVESSDDAIIGKSPAGIIQSWNPGADQLYGYTAEEAIGQCMRVLLPSDRQDEEADILDRLRRGGFGIHFETVRIRKNGTAIDVSVKISPIRDKGGQIIGFSHVARDITDQKRHAEEMRQTQKLESLGVLAGGIAHDFNNLLTGILGNASMALDDLAPQSPLRAPIEAVIAASERAAELARQMLAYSGKGRFVLEHIDLSARVRETLPLIKAAIPSTVELRLDLDQHLPAIQADGAQVQQLIMNIIINGAEAIPEGTTGAVTITTRCEQMDEQDLPVNEGTGAVELQAGAYVVFEVADTGVGMDEQTKARIFDPFFTTKFTGRGLGLAAVLGIVRGHRGSMQVFSATGEGTTFRVLLPAVEAAEDHPAAVAERPATDLRGRGLILVVDDEPVVRKMASQTLERYGYEVLVAEDGARGLELFQREASRIACVVLDLTMPVMSGEETLPRMKIVHPGIPIILSSGFNEVEAVRRFAGKGLAGFLQKPYKTAMLLEAVKRVMLRPESGDTAAAGGSGDWQ
jgi:two-component system cell cycle sensor histidine kinase/response regulator CckA